jgi:hypothetical protein
VLRKSKDLIGSTIHATNGAIGSVSTLYFDDDRWTVRYFVVDIGHWLPARKVLISPLSVRQVSSVGRSIDTSQNSPEHERHPT